MFNNKYKQNTEAKKVSNKSFQEPNVQNESKITKVLKELNIKWLVILMIIILIMIPFFEQDLWLN